MDEARQQPDAPRWLAIYRYDVESCQLTRVLKKDADRFALMLVGTELFYVTNAGIVPDVLFHEIAEPHHSSMMALALTVAANDSHSMGSGGSKDNVLPSKAVGTERRSGDNSRPRRAT